MLTLNVENMTCGHCVKAITQAVLAADPQAKIDITLENKQVMIQTQLEANQVISILEDEGYPTKVLN